MRTALLDATRDVLRVALLAPLFFLVSVSRGEPGVADIMAPHTKRVEATFEVTGLRDQPGYLFVVYPYLSSMFWGMDASSFFAMNPQADKPGTNYQVLREGERYVMPKFGGGRIYAFKKEGLTVEEVTLTEPQGFYRSAGSKVAVIREFDALTETGKRDFVEHDPRVRPSNARVDFPLTVPDDRPFDATHDVLRVAAIDDERLHIEGVKVVLSSKDGGVSEAPYEQQKRPAAAGGDDLDGEPVEPEKILVVPSGSGSPADRSRAPAPAGHEPHMPLPIGLGLAAVGLLAVLSTRSAWRP